MAVTTSKYNHTLKLLLNQEVDLDALKVMLLSEDATFTAAHTTVDAVTNEGAYEVHGNGWDQGGEALSGEAVSIANTSGAIYSASNLEVTASGGPIGPAPKALIYDATNDLPLFFIDFGEAKKADDGTPFKVTFSADGIAKITWVS